MSRERFTAFEKDILTEIGSMCAGNATTALALILGKRIELHSPRLNFITSNKLPWHISNHPEEVTIGIHMQVLGEAHGNALIVFPKKSAFQLVEILIGPIEGTIDSPTEIGISALKEMGNVVISSYLSTLTVFTGISAFSSTVNLTSGATKYLARLGFFGLEQEENEETVLIEAVFTEAKKNILGNLFIIFDAKSIAKILEKAKQMVK